MAKVECYHTDQWHHIQTLRLHRHNGKWHDVWVLSPDPESARYWLEEIDLSGKSTWHGPVAISRLAQAGPLPSTDLGQAALLSNLDRKVARQPPTQLVGRHATRSSLPTVSSARQALLAAQPAVKLSVTQEGWYRVTQPELLAAGLNGGVDPRRLQ
jgi:hypothetical protein